MKKLLFNLFLILLIVFIVFTALDYKGTYSAERDLWKINDKFSQAAIDPKSIPDSTFESLASRYQAFIKKYPDSALVPPVQILIGRVYLTKGDYARAREQFEKIIKIYKDKPNVGVEAAADIGRTYALENNSEMVLKNYERVKNEFPLTPIGMQAPLILAKYHSERGDVEKTQAAFDAAITHFKKIIKDNPDSTIEFNALRSLGATYLASKKFDEAVNTFGTILLKFPQRKYLNSARINTLVKTINTVSVVELQDYERPIKIYSTFIKKHPEHPFNNSFKEMMKSLQLLREKKVEFTLQQQK